MAKSPIFKSYMSKCSLDSKELNDIHLVRSYRDLLFLWPNIARGAQFSGAQFSGGKRHSKNGIYLNPASIPL